MAIHGFVSTLILVMYVICIGPEADDNEIDDDLALMRTGTMEEFLTTVLERNALDAQLLDPVKLPKAAVPSMTLDAITEEKQGRSGDSSLYHQIPSIRTPATDTDIMVTRDNRLKYFESYFCRDQEICVDDKYLGRYCGIITAINPIEVS